MLQLHPSQSEIYLNIFMRKQPYTVLNAGRGFGKSFLIGSAAATAAMELQQMPDDVPNKHVHILAPTFDQVIDTYYPMLMYNFGLEERGVKGVESRGRIYLPNRTEIRLISYEAIERMRGKGSYFFAWDEVTSCYKGIRPRDAWESIIRPCLVTRWSQLTADKYGAPSKGRALFGSTPKGYDFFHDLSLLHTTDPEWAYSHKTYRDSPYLSAREIEQIRADTDPIRFAREYEALFKESGASVFHAFDREIHVRALDGPILPSETINAAIDFNVGKQNTSFNVIRGGQVFWFDEISGYPDTEHLARAIKVRFPNNKVNAFPDPSGKSRKTSAKAGKTDFTILQEAGISVYARKAHPGIVDSVNCVNRLLMNANGQVNMFFTGNVKELIKSMERTVWVEGTSASAMIDKSGDIEHSSDGVRYFSEYLFPISGRVVSHQSSVF